MTTVRVVTQPGNPRLGKAYVLSVPQGTGQPDRRLDRLIFSGRRDGQPVWTYGDMIHGETFVGSLRDAVIWAAHKNNIITVDIRFEHA
jgi:hypothetical protein